MALFIKGRRESLDFWQPGHFVRDCPTRNEVGDTGGKKPRQGYVCRACGSENHYLEDCLVANQRPVQDERHGGRCGPPKEIAPDECWFCLSNPNLAYVFLLKFPINLILHFILQEASYCCDWGRVLCDPSKRTNHTNTTCRRPCRHSRRRTCTHRPYYTLSDLFNNSP